MAAIAGKVCRGGVAWPLAAAAAAGLAVVVPEQRRRRPRMEAAQWHGGQVPITARYTMKSTLGKGHSGTVCAAVDRRSGELCAVKSLPKAKACAEQVRDEVAVHQDVSSHPNVVELREVFEDSNAFYMVMELARGGELFEHLIAEGAMGERQAAALLRQISEAVAHLHAKGWVHFDIKPENIMLTGDNRGRLADFGSSFRMAADGRRRQRPRNKEYTTAYSAPEVVSGGEVDEKADVWALGVVAYILLQGSHPFDPTSEAGEAEIVDNIVRAEPDMGGPGWQGLSADATGLIRRMLSKDPSKRPSAREVLGSSWLARAEGEEEACCSAAGP